MLRKTIVAVSFLLITVAPTAAPRDAFAANDAVSQAKRLFKRAQIHYNVGEFEKALELYTAAYKLKQLPGFLFNIAQCHRLAGRCDRALFFYDRYLSLLDAKPTAHRQEVEGFVRACKEALAAKPASGAGAASEHKPKAAAPQTGAKTPPGSSPAGKRPRGKTLKGVSAKPASRPLTWVWVGVGSAAALILAGAVTGAMAQSKNDEYRDPSTSAARAAELKHAGKPLAVVSVIAFAAAGAAASAALLRYFFAEHRSGLERAQVTASPLPHGIAAQLRVDF